MGFVGNMNKLDRSKKTALRPPKDDLHIMKPRSTLNRDNAWLTAMIFMALLIFLSFATAQETSSDMSASRQANAPAAPALSIKMELPPRAAGLIGAWAVARPGHVAAEGVFNPPASDHYDLLIDNAGLVPDGDWEIHLTLNMPDGRVSAFPSFGDRYTTAPLKIAHGIGKAAVKRGDWREKKLSLPVNLFTIHYHRNQGDYADATIWSWDLTRHQTPANNELFPVGHDDFGLIFELDLADYGLTGAADFIGLLPRFGADWNRKDGTDRRWQPAKGREIWMIGGLPEIHTARPDTSHQVTKAYLDSSREITIVLSHAFAPGRLRPDDVTLTDGAGARIAIEAIEPLPPITVDGTRFLRVRAMKDFDDSAITDGMTIGLTGYRPRVVTARRILSDPKKFFDASTPLGAIYSKSQTTFRVFAPTARAVNVVVSKSPRGDDSKAAHPMKKIGKGIWEITVKGDHANQFYSYTLDAPGLDPANEVIDPYALGRAGHDGRGIIVDLDSTNPPGFDPAARPPLAAPTDAIIYEMHMRGMTIDKNSGVKHKGQYLGMAEDGTHHPADPKTLTALAHAKELGVTHLQVMPLQDFDNTEPSTEYNWGYMPVNFFYPDGMFATDVNTTARITETKRFIQAAHEAGLRVVLDVVFNHTSGPSPFDHIVPNYYHRMMEDGNYWNGSGTGNEFHSEQPMARRFIVDSCRFWVEEYGIDGFRFDLMGLIDMTTMLEVRDAVRAIDPTILVYGEPWAGGATGIAQITDKQRLRTSGIGAFNDHFRDAIKGGTRGGSPGYVQNGTNPGAFISGLQASILDWSWSPDEVIQYCSAHDDLCLRDKLEESLPGAGEALLKRKQKLAIATLLVAQGLPFIFSGDDIFATKMGVENSYNAGDKINMIHWDWKREHRDVFDYVRGMIALRKAHPLFRLPESDEIKKRVKFNPLPLPSSAAVAMLLDGLNMPSESAAAILVLFNPEHHSLAFMLPEGEWLIVADDALAGAAPLRSVKGQATVGESSLMVLVKPKKASE